MPRSLPRLSPASTHLSTRFSLQCTCNYLPFPPAHIFDTSDPPQHIIQCDFPLSHILDFYSPSSTHRCCRASRSHQLIESEALLPVEAGNHQNDSGYNLNVEEIRVVYAWRMPKHVVTHPQRSKHAENAMYKHLRIHYYFMQHF